MHKPAQSTAIIGMGKTGVSVARFCIERGMPCVAFDEHAVTLPDDINIPLHIGELNSHTLTEYAQIVVSPGIRWQHPVLRELRQKNIPMFGDLDLFLEHCSAPIIAVTGTNGKTTTTEMIGLLLETLHGGCMTGGNIGIPMLDLLRQSSTPARVALELSSFQLERSHRLHANTAIFLNVQADHVDAYDSEVAYLDAKLKIFAQQQQGDTAYLPHDKRWDTLAEELIQRDVHIHRFAILSANAIEAESLSAGIIDDTLFWHHDGHRIEISCKNIPAKGQHQHLNLAIAAQVAADEGVHIDVIREAITSFRGLPHRLRNLGKIAGHTWFDDSKATNPAAAKAALEAFDKVIWICGGLRKGIDLAPLKESVQQHVALAIIIGLDTQSYSQFLNKAGIPYKVAGVIRNAVEMAAVEDNDLPVLLSPAAASQDQFKDYAQRGQAFYASIKALGDST